MPQEMELQQAVHKIKQELGYFLKKLIRETVHEHIIKGCTSGVSGKQVNLSSRGNGGSKTSDNEEHRSVKGAHLAV